MKRMRNNIFSQKRAIAIMIRATVLTIVALFGVAVYAPNVTPADNLTGSVRAITYQLSGCTLPNGNTDGVEVGTATQPMCCPHGSGTTSPQACLYAKYVNPLVQLLSAAVGLVVVIAVVYGGIEYITAGADPQRLGAARKRIASAVLGLMAYILLYAFLQFVIPGALHG